MNTTIIQQLNMFERYVNDGSPTGLTFVHASSDITSPFLGTPGFSLPLIWLDRNVINTDGVIPGFLQRDDQSVAFPLHPDCWRHVPLKTRRASTINDTLLVQPTASARTVLYEHQGHHMYLKLHYPFILGRFSAELREEKLSLPIRISKALMNHEAELEGISFLPEIGTIEAQEVGKPPCDGKAGVLIRSAAPFNCPPLSSMIPFFSLHARNNLVDSERPLIESLTHDVGNKALYLIDKVLRPLIRSFWKLVGDFGLWPEAHGQNIILGYEAGNFAGHVIWRDFQGFYRERGLSDEFLELKSQAGSYHLLPRDRDNLLKKRSQLYDCYLGEYCLTPLLAGFDRSVRDNARAFVIDLTRELTQKYAINLPEDRWYALPLRAPAHNEILNLEEHAAPKYR